MANRTWRSRWSNYARAGQHGRIWFGHGLRGFVNLQAYRTDPLSSAKDLCRGLGMSLRDRPTLVTWESSHDIESQPRGVPMIPLHPSGRDG